MLKHIFLDFDGVIVDSTSLKHDAFISLTENEKAGTGIILDNLMKTKLIGAERHVICKWIKENTDSYKTIHKLMSEFSEMIDLNILNLSLAEGFQEFLLLAGKKNCLSMSIVSNAPSSDIISYLANKLISFNFSFILGQENMLSKEHRINAILEKLSLLPSECFFIGDTPSDFLASKICEVPFIKIESYLGNLCFWDETIKGYHNFFEIIELINKKEEENNI